MVEILMIRSQSLPTHTVLNSNAFTMESLSFSMLNMCQFLSMDLVKFNFLRINYYVQHVNVRTYVHIVCRCMYNIYCRCMYVHAVCTVGVRMYMLYVDLCTIYTLDVRMYVHAVCRCMYVHTCTVCECII